MANNVLTTLITLAVKAGIKDDGLPVEVQQMMAAIDADVGGATMKAKVASSMKVHLFYGSTSMYSLIYSCNTSISIVHPFPYPGTSAPTFYRG